MENLKIDSIISSTSLVTESGIEDKSLWQVSQGKEAKRKIIVLPCFNVLLACFLRSSIFPKQRSGEGLEVTLLNVSSNHFQTYLYLLPVF